MINFLKKYWSHPALALLVTGIFTAFGQSIIGATVATAIYFGRESGQCKACNQYTLQPYYRFDKWSMDNHLDFWPVLVVWAIPAAVYFWPV